MVRNRIGGRYDSLRKQGRNNSHLAILLTIIISCAVLPQRPLQDLVLQGNSAHAAHQSRVFVSWTKHCATGALALCGEVLRCPFYAYGEILEKERNRLCKVIQ